MAELTLYPDRWLLCSARVEAALRGPWADGVAAGSLAAIRLRWGLVETVALAQLAARVQQLQQQGCGTLRIVVDRLDAAEQQAIDALRNSAADLRLHVWRDDALEVMDTLAAPEEALLQAWEAGHGRPAALAFSGPLQHDQAWARAYAAALTQWQDSARAAHGPAFEELYGAGPLWQPLGESAWRLADGVVIAVRDRLAAFAQVPAALGLAPGTAGGGARRGEPGLADVPAGSYGTRIQLPWPDSGAQAELAARHSPQTHATQIHCRVQGLPPADVQLRLWLEHGGRKLLMGQFTGEAEATFANLEPGSYLLEMRDMRSGASLTVPVDIKVAA